jgi:peptide-methionine (S)-S-oxide reductase
MIKQATFGAGCFWCIEACYLSIKGVISVSPGYCGGNTKNPTYEDVCKGTTGHAEVVRVVYDDEVVSYDTLLEMFWFVHDPTQLNRQGHDIGTQYRSIIFYHDISQKERALFYKNKLQNDRVWENPIVTEIEEVSEFYKAEDYHHDYFKKNPGNMYCQSVVRPKVEKFSNAFLEKLKNKWS